MKRQIHGGYFSDGRLLEEKTYGASVRLVATTDEIDAVGTKWSVALHSYSKHKKTVVSDSPYVQIFSGDDIKAMCTGLLALRERRMKATHAGFKKAKKAVQEEKRHARRRYVMKIIDSVLQRKLLKGLLSHFRVGNTLCSKILINICVFSILNLVFLAAFVGYVFPLFSKLFYSCLELESVNFEDNQKFLPNQL
ncbi:unnamed protein product [Citrullus colocynthis]|uniref:Uncharacterized protein n=1 Tax=Citrullus colocynthis TaxID=252529 RepID=A0ABP0YSV8_9ROSI